MKTSYLTNLILLIMLGFLYWLNTQVPTEEHASKTLSNVSPKSIDRIIISQVKRPDIVLVKHDQAWHLTQPLQVNANPTRIQLLLSLLTMQARRQQTMSDQQNLEQFGFNNNSTRLQLGEQHFIFGNIEAISQQRYVLHNQTVSLVDDTISPLLNTNASSFIDNRLLPYQKLTKLSLPSYQSQHLVGITQTLNLSKGHWTSRPAYPSDTLIALVDAWQHAYALQVLPLPAIASKLEQLTGHTASLWFEGSIEPVQFTLYLSDNALLIIDSVRGLAYQFPRDFYQQLLHSQ